MIGRVGIWEFNLRRDCRSRSANDAPNAATKQDPKRNSNIQDAITIPLSPLPLPPKYLGITTYLPIETYLPGQFCANTLRIDNNFY